MITWNPYKEFSSEFLSQHHDLVLYGIFHHIKAFLLFPPNCSCDDSCRCSEWREKTILALNTNQYTKSHQTAEEPDRLYAMKALWRIPEDHLFRELYAEAYPIWVIEKELKDREKNNHFKIIDQLVWTFLRLGETAKFYSGIPKVSLNEAMKIILGETPINTKVIALKKAEHFCGEKEYASNFKKYKFVCHFIAALETCKKEVPDWERVFTCLYPPLEHIERFLSIAHWFREKLLSLERRNVKDKIFLSEGNICPLPAWIQSDNIDFSIELSEEKFQKVKSKNSAHQ